MRAARTALTLALAGACALAPMPAHAGETRLTICRVEGTDPAAHDTVSHPGGDDADVHAPTERKDAPSTSQKTGSAGGTTPTAGAESPDATATPGDQLTRTVRLGARTPTTADTSCDERALLVASAACLATGLSLRRAHAKGPQMRG